MTVFVLAAAALTLLAMGAVLFGPRPRRGTAAEVSQARVNAEVLRQLLGELDSERERGLLDEGEFARARDELQRRLLAEAASSAATPAAQARPRRALLAFAAALPVAAAALYQQFGHPQLLAGPSASFEVAEPRSGDLASRLEAHLAAAPDDARAWVMLARMRMDRDQFDAAAQAYQRALGASPKVALDPLVWCEYADALGMAAGGRLEGRPRELIDKALSLDAAHPRALEMAGSAAYEAGDFRSAAGYWRQLLARLPADSAEHTQLAAAVARAEQRARFVLPAS
jgi:cytochrome c-type biogenesis protein CcmH